MEMDRLMDELEEERLGFFGLEKIKLRNRIKWM